MSGHISPSTTRTSAATSAGRRSAEVRDTPPTKDEAKSIVPLFRRQRIREVTEQVHGLVVQRVKDAKRPHDLASLNGLALEIQALTAARRSPRATGGDVRSCFVAIAASCILLAEIADRPSEPKRGRKRAETKRWKPIDFTV